MTSPHITVVTEANFEDEVLKSDKLVLIDFYADWCGPCKAMTPVLEKFAEENKDTVKVVKINVDDNQKLAAASGIQSIPTFFTVKDGKAIDRKIGGMGKKDLEKFVADSFAKIATPPANNKKTKGPTP